MSDGHTTDGVVRPEDVADPISLSLKDLRSLRSWLQAEDDAISYVRRVAQARMDLVTTESNRRSGAGSEVVDVLSQHLVGGSARPPRPVEDMSDDPLTRELDAICMKYHFGRLSELDDGALQVLGSAISCFERRVSRDRRVRYDRLNALSAELARRYRDGEATVESLLND